MQKTEIKQENKIDIEKLPILNVGVVGHIDHGKTSLLYALTGKFTDTHSEELKRGITIKLGYADILLRKEKNSFGIEKGEPYRYITFVDVPGHEMLMATMLSGAAIIDAAILVVAANEGIKPQTREHLMALHAKKIKELIVVQNKIDLVEKDKAMQNYKDIKEMLKGKYDTAPIIPVSAQQEINLGKIYEAIAEIKLPERKIDADPLFLIARSFDINKPGAKPEELHGTVLGGTLKQGTIKNGDVIEIKPGRVIKEANQYHYKTIRTKVVKLFKGSKEVSELTPRGSMSIETELDMSLGKGDLLSGCVASREGLFPGLAENIKVKYNLFPEIF